MERLWIIKLLRLTERIDLAIQIGESHFREFKSAFEGPPNNKKPRDAKVVAKDIAETLVAFANADGGELIVGIEDDGSVTGLGYGDDKIQLLLDAPRTRVHADTALPSVRAVRLLYGGHSVLYFSVPQGTSYVYITSDGRCLQRKDLESVPISSEQIKLSRDEITSREYDRHFVDNADIQDLDIRLLTSVAEQISKGMSIEKCLQHLDVAVFDGTRLRLRKAALLLFAGDARKWHPRAQVRILRINGTELKTGSNYNVTIDDPIDRNIIELVNDSWDHLRPHLAETGLLSVCSFKACLESQRSCRKCMNRKPYSSDLTDAQWLLLPSALAVCQERWPYERPTSAKSSTRSLPQPRGLHLAGSCRDFPPGGLSTNTSPPGRPTAPENFSTAALRRRSCGWRRAVYTPTTASIDSQTVKAAEAADSRNWKPGAKKLGRKHIVVDSLELAAGGAGDEGRRSRRVAAARCWSR